MQGVAPVRRGRLASLRYAGPPSNSSAPRSLAGSVQARRSARVRVPRRRGAAARTGRCAGRNGSRSRTTTRPCFWSCSRATASQGSERDARAVGESADWRYSIRGAEWCFPGRRKGHELVSLRRRATESGHARRGLALCPNSCGQALRFVCAVRIPCRRSRSSGAVAVAGNRSSQRPGLWRCKVVLRSPQALTEQAAPTFPT